MCGCPHHCVKDVYVHVCGCVSKHCSLQVFWGKPTVTPVPHRLVSSTILAPPCPPWLVTWCWILVNIATVVGHLHRLPLPLNARTAGIVVVSRIWKTLKQEARLKITRWHLREEKKCGIVAQDCPASHSSGYIQADTQSKHHILWFIIDRKLKKCSSIVLSRYLTSPGLCNPTAPNLNCVWLCIYRINKGGRVL